MSQFMADGSFYSERTYQDAYTFFVSLERGRVVFLQFVQAGQIAQCCPYVTVILTESDTSLLKRSFEEMLCTLQIPLGNSNTKAHRASKLSVIESTRGHARTYILYGQVCGIHRIWIGY